MVNWTDKAKQLRIPKHRAVGGAIMTFALEHVSSGVFVDGGACVGAFSIPVLLKRPDARCVAFEPGKVMHSSLVEMAHVNGVSDRMQIHRAALWERAESLHLHIPSKPERCGLSTLGKPGRFKDWEREEVQAVPLDSLELDVQLIKLDLEGAELFALRGALDTLERCRPALIVENQQVNTSQFGYLPSETGDLLESLGYTCERRTKNDLFCLWIRN